MMRTLTAGQRTWRLALNVFWILLFSMSVQAGENRTNIAVANGFEVQMWVVDGERWKWTDAEDIPRTEFLARIDRSRKPHIFFLLRNPPRDDEGNSYVTARILIRRPDGSLLREVKRLPLWTLRKPFPRDTFSGGMQYTDLPLKDSDPNGDYTIEATVEDHVTRTALPVHCVLKIEQSSSAN